MEPPSRSQGGTEGPVKCPAFGSVSMSMVWVIICLLCTNSLTVLPTPLLSSGMLDLAALAAAVSPRLSGLVRWP